MRDNRPRDKPPTRPRTNGTKWRFYCGIKQRKAGLSPGTGPILSRGGVPFVPRTVPVCPGRRPAENVYVYWFFLSGKSKRGLSKGGLRAWPERRQLGQKGRFRGNFCSFPVGVGCGGIGPDRRLFRPRQALKRLQSAPKRPDFPGRISPRFSQKIWGLSPRL